MPLRSILLVDDEPDIRTLVTLILERLGGMQVRAESSGQDALAALESGFRPDLILLDVMMPGMDGVQTLAHIRAHPDLAGLPVCFLTAKVHPAELQRWHDQGVNAVLTKPFSPARLVEQIRECWDDVRRSGG
ncbi:MAG: response regulator [Perlucidibaca sp.]